VTLVMKRFSGWCACGEGCIFGHGDTMEKPTAKTQKISSEPEDEITYENLRESSTDIFLISWNGRGMSPFVVSAERRMSMFLRVTGSLTISE
jgi:hypothetical protein